MTQPYQPTQQSKACHGPGYEPRIPTRYQPLGRPLREPTPPPRLAVDRPALRDVEASPLPKTSRRLLAAATPALVFLGVRGSGILILASMSWAHGGSVLEELSSWDGEWLLGIAEVGYRGMSQSDHYDAFGKLTLETPFGFFPGYPIAVGALRALGINTLAAGLLVSLLSGVATAYALTRLTALTPGGSRRAGLILVALFASAPMGVVLSMTYTEALFCALAAWALVWILREQWIPAAVCCALAGLVRPTAMVLIGTIVLAVVVAMWRGDIHWRSAIAAVLLAPIGFLGYFIFVVMRTGSRDGWFGVQERGWGWTFDGGIGTVQWMKNVLLSGNSLFEVVGVFVVLGSIVLLAISSEWHLPWQLLVYGAGVIVMVVGTGGLLLYMKARFLLPAFVLLIPIAVSLAERRQGTVVSVLAAATLVSAWFGGYALTAWDNAL